MKQVRIAATARWILVVLIIAVPGIASACHAADEWGTLKGRFVLDGDVPKPIPIKVNKDPEICGKKGLFREDLVVDSKGGLANVMIYCRDKVRIHPSYEKTAADRVVLKARGGRFEPHVLGIRVGQTFVFENDDPVAHDAYVSGSHFSFPQIIPASSGWEEKIEEADVVPAQVTCNIHPWMNARVLLRPDPYFCVTKNDGSFEIKNLPVGEFEFAVFHEKLKQIESVEIKGEKVTWPKGVVKVAILAGGETDLGDIRLSVTQPEESPAAKPSGEK